MIHAFTDPVTSDSGTRADGKPGGGGGGTPHNGIYGEAPPEMRLSFPRWRYIKGWPCFTS